jgi:hypothetical protein
VESKSRALIRLLNTAKLMEDNPLLVRLKEFETEMGIEPFILICLPQH